VCILAAMSGPSRKIPVGVLGATGAVGQRMVYVS
jgi:hypothetical protein